MALGDNNNRELRPTVYSGYTFYNTRSEKAKSRMNFSMWKNTIKLSIERMVKESNDGYGAEFDTENPALLYLTASKALVLTDLLKAYLRDPEQYSGFGVESARALITITREGDDDVLTVSTKNGSEIGDGLSYVLNHSFPVVEKVKEDGSISYNNSFASSTDIKQLIFQLDDYVHAMNNTIAFSVIDNLARNTQSKYSFLKEALSGGSSYGNNNSGSRYGKGSASQNNEVDDLDDFM